MVFQGLPVAEPDILNQKDAEGQFVSGRAASFICGLDTYTNIRQRLLAGVPGAELGVWVYYALPKIRMEADFRLPCRPGCAEEQQPRAL